VREYCLDIWSFIQSVTKRWISLGGGSAIGFILLWCAAYKQEVPVTAVWWILGSCLAIAAFQDWRDKLREKKALQTKLDALAERGDLRLTILHFDYNGDTEKLEAQLMFSNDDALSQRTVIGVNFIYRASSDSNFALYHTGTPDAMWIGHVDPVELLPRTEAIRKYEAVVPRAKFDVIGAQAGLHITFSVPVRPTDNATVMAMEIVESNLTTPSRHYPGVERLSLDSISQARQIESIRRAISPPSPAS
jgi:hypothetical protein